MTPRLLSEAEYKATFAEPMTTYVGKAIVDIWPYIKAVPATDLEGNAVYADLVDRSYLTGDGRYHHVLVMTWTKNVFLVVIVDVPAVGIVGHYLLDLNREYGLR